MRLAGDPSLFVPKAYYFSYYAAGACLMPFLVLYYRQLGLSGPQIGLLAGLAPVVTWLSAPLWGLLADALQRHRLLLLVAIVGAITAALTLAQATAFGWLLVVVAAYAFFVAPIMPLVDNSVMALLGARSAEYGKQRLWGAVGWGLAGAGAGVLVERLGASMSFYAYASWMALGLLVALRLPISRAPIGQSVRLALRGLAANSQLLVFLATVLVAGMAMSTVHSFLFLYLLDLGASEALMGLSLTVATVSELPVFFFSDRLLRWMGARGLLLLSLAANVARLGAYALMPAAWLVLPINLLHGLTFSAMWVAGVSYANQIAPVGMGATVQGLFSGMVMGLGAAAGALLGGALYDSVGPARMYGVAALCVGLGILFFWRAGRAAVNQR
ncbi:MAG TPA: major facilitator superfamily domain-containing protein 6 [Caldilineaceae bacterium]|nr:major facilitator superfamily domain-containing protein 6 [Caldilineaceae bacterium]